MKNYRFNFIILFFIAPILAMGQIPKEHFLDSDGKVKPFKQPKERLYHYAVISELPFENSCPEDQTEKEKINCAEDSLSELLRERLKLEFDYKGRVYIYLTVNEDAEIYDVNVTSYPNSKQINEQIHEVVKTLPVKPALYQDKIVKSRLWTFLVLD